MGTNAKLTTGFWHAMCWTAR